MIPGILKGFELVFLPGIPDLIYNRSILEIGYFGHHHGFVVIDFRNDFFKLLNRFWLHVGSLLIFDRILHDIGYLENGLRKCTSYIINNINCNIIQQKILKKII